MARDTDTHRDFTHAGAGTSQVIVLLSVMIPGLLPSLALLGVVTAVLVIPVVALGLAATLVIAPPLGLWRVATRGRRHRQREERTRPPSDMVTVPRQGHVTGPAPASAHVSPLPR